MFQRVDDHVHRHFVKEWVVFFNELLVFVAVWVGFQVELSAHRRVLHAWATEASRDEAHGMGMPMQN